MTSYKIKVLRCLMMELIWKLSLLAKLARVNRSGHFTYRFNYALFNHKDLHDTSKITV